MLPDNPSNSPESPISTNPAFFTSSAVFPTSSSKSCLEKSDTSVSVFLSSFGTSTFLSFFPSREKTATPITIKATTTPIIIPLLFFLLLETYVDCVALSPKCSVFSALLSVRTSLDCSVIFSSFSSGTGSPQFGHIFQSSCNSLPHFSQNIILLSLINFQSLFHRLDNIFYKEYYISWKLVYKFFFTITNFLVFVL